MKKFFAIAAAILISIVSFAQEKGPYETNAFGDNVFWGLGIGGNDIWQWSNKGSVPFVTVPGLAFEGYVGKWFTPGLGTRVGYYGFSQDKFNNGQHVLAVDLMWNFSNSVYGYKADRKWTWAPYLRAGLDVYGDTGLFKGLNNEWVLGFGSMLIHPLNDKLNLTIDNPIEIAKASEMSSTAANIKNDNTFNKITSKFAFPYAILVGLQWNVGKTTWNTTAATAAAAAAAIAAAEAAANKKADKAIADANTAAKTAQDEAKQLVDEAKKAAGSNVDGLFDEPVVVYFTIGKSTLSKTEKAHAEYAIKNIISRGENVKFTLNGSADTGTGSKKRNEQLSKERAQTVYNLVDELGVSRENITVVEWDGTERFATPELNRAVIIEKQ